jgi:hypothetical protein
MNNFKNLVQVFRCQADSDLVSADSLFCLSPFIGARNIINPSGSPIRGKDSVQADLESAMENLCKFLMLQYFLNKML